MTTTSFTCPHCNKIIDISDALRHQIDDELKQAKAAQSETIKAENDKLISEAVAVAVGAQTERLKQEAAESKQSEKQLRGQIKELLAALSAANREKENAEINARKELLKKEAQIREDAKRDALEESNTKIREQSETINKLTEQLKNAQLTAEQGSQQLQGEILELDIEQALRAAFPGDTIEEVKAGERGTDIRQNVNEKLYLNCGLILWECKNAKTYQPSWLSKLKETLAAEKAQFGIIVFNPTAGGGQDLSRLADNIWLVKPRNAVLFATALREVLIRVFIANRNAQGKDAKVEMMYNYLTGGEFSNRIQDIIEAYNELSAGLKQEKIQAKNRWAKQEKIIEKITDGLFGMNGDVYGITGREIIALPEAGGND